MIKNKDSKNHFETEKVKKGRLDSLRKDPRQRSSHFPPAYNPDTTSSDQHPEARQPEQERVQFPSDPGQPSFLSISPHTLKLTTPQLKSILAL